MIYKIVENSVIYTIKNNNQQNHRTTMPLGRHVRTKENPGRATDRGGVAPMGGSAMPG